MLLWIQYLEYKLFMLQIVYVCVCVSFLWLLLQITTNLVTLINSKSLSHYSEDQESEKLYSGPTLIPPRLSGRIHSSLFQLLVAVSL